MSKRIIFKNADGGVSVLIPAPNCPLTLAQIASKDVPNGSPYKIVDVGDVPSDRTYRNAWDVNEADLVDGVGGPEGAQ